MPSHFDTDLYILCPRLATLVTAFSDNLIQVPNFYGFLGVFGVHVTLPATRMYYFAYPMGLALSFGTYWALSKLDPPICSNMGQMFHEVGSEAEDAVIESASVAVAADADVDLRTSKGGMGLGASEKDAVLV